MLLKINTGDEKVKRVFLPLVAASSRITGEKTFFRTNEEILEVSAPSALMRNMIDACDGTKTDKSIMELLGKNWEGGAVIKLFKALRRHSVIVDARRVNDQIWNVVKNPLSFPNILTEKDVSQLVDKATKRHNANPSSTAYAVQASALESLLEKRHSVRTFSGEPASHQSIVDLLWSAYGELATQNDGRIRRTVPSAGALYPLVIHLALLRQTDRLPPAIYSVYLGKQREVGFRKESDDILELQRSFLDPIMLESACGIIIISGSFEIGGEKYGNRGMLYVPLEAGHAAQNIHLSASENHIATVEIGGFVDELVAKSIRLPNGYHPLTTIVFGQEATEPDQEHSAGTMALRWAIPMSGRYRPAFANASVRLSPKRSWSHGRDPSPVLAYTKAVAEAREWTACGNVPKTTISAKFEDLPTAVDPQSVLKFHPLQYRTKRFPFSPFDTNKAYEWTEGHDELNGSAVHILADLVYFPYFPKTPYYAYANSSGVAANPNAQKALETSLLELIERDAFMIAYLARLRMPIVKLRSLPGNVQQRLRELDRVGFRTRIVDISMGMTPVIFVFSQNTDLHCTTCSAASEFNAETALDHALLEVESFVLARLQNGPAKPIKPSEVAMPLDHGILYEQARYFRMADFLVSGKRMTDFRNVGGGTATSMPNLMSRFKHCGYRLISIPLHVSDQYGGDDGLTIVRSLVPGFIPMTFGYGQAPLGMQRIYNTAKRQGRGDLSYRDLTSFPHPFA